MMSPWLPAMEVLNDVHGASTADEPPMRDLEGVYTAVHVRRVPNMHALTADGANQEEAKDSRLPAPEHPLLTRLTEAELAEVIERHIDYFDPKDQRSVHLAGPFVKHFMSSAALRGVLRRQHPHHLPVRQVAYVDRHSLRANFACRLAAGAADRAYGRLIVPLPLCAR